MSIKDFWQFLPMGQQETLQAQKSADLEAYAEEHQLLVHNGKLVKPEDYPCDCELQDPEQCFEQNKDSPDSEWSKMSVEAYLQAVEDKQCPCPCHRYYEPF